MRESRTLPNLLPGWKSRSRSIINYEWILGLETKNQLEFRFRAGMHN